MNSRDLLVVLLVIVGAVLLLPVLGMSFGHFGMMGPWMMGRGFTTGYGGGLGLLVMLLFVGGIALLVLGFTRRDAQSQEPLNVLKLRLARGEITPEQYEELKQAIQR
jgi:uncharacterized membrane protein